MEIKDIKAEYRMQEMHKMIRSRAESGLSLREFETPLLIYNVLLLIAYIQA